MKATPEIKNSKAKFDYIVLDEYVAGMVLPGKSVKAVRSGRVTLTDTYAHFDIDGNLTANVQVSSEPSMRLLLTKKELRKIREEIKKPGITLVPLKIFFAHGLAKMLLGLCKGKKEYDKRAAIKERDLKREIKNYL